MVGKEDRKQVDVEWEVREVELNFRYKNLSPLELIGVGRYHYSTSKFVLYLHLHAKETDSADCVTPLCGTPYMQTC